LKVFEWLEATHPGRKGLSRPQKAVLVTLRNKVCRRAGTSINILVNAKCRGSIGRNLVERLEKATKDESFKIKLADELIEICDE
jgi:hypothetical protein